MSNTPKFKKLDLVWSIGGDGDICVVLYGPIDIPYFTDGCGSGAADYPFDFEDPNEWLQTFPGYIVANMTKNGEYEIRAEHDIKLCDPTGTSYIPFDQATSKKRCISGLLKLSDKWNKIHKEQVGKEYENAPDDQKPSWL